MTRSQSFLVSCKPCGLHELPPVLILREYKLDVVCEAVEDSDLISFVRHPYGLKVGLIALMPSL